MAGYMSLEEQVDADFTRARRRAFFRCLKRAASVEARGSTGGLPAHEGERGGEVEANRQDLPPRRGVSTREPVKIGDSYFVADGNHRVSVTRSHGVERIDAEVTEFSTSVALDTLVVLGCSLGFYSWILELPLYAATR